MKSEQSSTSVQVFVNPSAGRGQAGRNTAGVRAAFDREQIAAEIRRTESLEDFVQQVRIAKAAGCGKFVAMGGDGTAQMLVRELAECGATVGIIPAGGGNDFAAALGIPKDLNGAVRVIADGKTRLVDLAVAKFANGEQRIYLGGGGMGLDAEAARLASGRFLRWPGRIRYLASAISALRGFGGIEVLAEFPGGESEQIRKRVLLAAVLNTPAYGGGLRLAPEARINDAKLDVVVVDLLSKSHVLALIPRLLISGELKTRRVTRVQTTKVKLSAAGDPWFQGDGELLGQAPVEITVQGSALRVLVPEDR